MKSLRHEANRADSLIRNSVDLSINNTGQSDDSYGLYLYRKVDFLELQAAAKHFFYFNIPVHYRTTLKDLASKDFEWRLHPMHGALFSCNQSLPNLAAFDEKPIEGFIDIAFFKKKRTQEVRDSFLNSSLILEEKPVVPFRTFIPKILSDNSLIAFASKGNLNAHQEIAVDFCVTFNKGMRITIMAEGEGPFAAQVPATHADEQLLRNESGVHLPGKDAVGPGSIERPGPPHEDESRRAPQRADQPRHDPAVRRDPVRRSR